MGRAPRVMFALVAACTLGAGALVASVATGAEPTVAVGAAVDGDGLRSAREAFEAGRYAEAVGELDRLLGAGALDAETTATGKHLLGLALLEGGEVERAVVVLGEALAAARNRRGSSLSDHLGWALARALALRGEHAKAAKTFRAVAEDPRSPLAGDAAYRRGLSLERAGDSRAARRAFERFLDLWPDSRRNLEGRVRLAGLEAARGRIERAVGLYREVLRLGPGSRAGLEAKLELERLAAAGHEVARPLRGAARLEELEWLVSERRFDEARPGLEELRGAGESASTRRRAGELLARLWRESGEHEKALKLYEELDASGPAATSPGRIARLQALLGRHEDAEKTLLASMRGRRGRAFWQAVAELRQEFGRYPEALKAWRKVARSSRSAEVARQVAWCTLWAGKPDKAIALLERVGERERSRRTWSRYWVARAYQEAGKKEEALKRFRALAADEELEFYGLLAWSRAAELEAGDAVPSAAVGVARTETSTLRWGPEVGPTRFDEAPKALPRAERLAALGAFADAWGDVAPEATRALELARLGFDDEALVELRVIDTDRRVLRWKGWRALVKRARSDLLDNRREKKARGGAPIRHLGRKSAREARRFGRSANTLDFRDALRSAQVALGDPYARRRSIIESGGLGAVPRGDTLERWRTAYPIAWPEAMSTFAAAHGVPAYFLYGVMTVESTFHPHAVSVSNAYGLLQVIPRTGRRVAEELSYGEFLPEILLEPHVAIYMGSHYMGRLLTRFAGQEPLAAAAYNAGPHRVAAWLEASPNRPMDAFLEEIPYRQARRYARSVLRHTARYRRVYHGEANMYVSNRLLPAVTAEPNY